MQVELKAIQEKVGITFLYVTHDQEEALSISDRIVVMSAGRMEQVGTPFDIYNFPTTSFVASFVGTLNQLRCTVVDAQQGILSYDGQSFQTSSSVAASNGASAVVMFRPEELHLFPREGDNRLTGKVEAVTFLGAVVRVQIRMGTALLTLDALNERKLTLPKVGDLQTASFPPHACWVMLAS